MSREEKKYITKLVQKGAEDGSSSDVEYIIKDSEARAELASINETIGNTRQISGFEDITTCINGLNTEVDTIQDNIGSLNNITNDDGKNKPIVTNINRIDTKVGELSDITVDAGKNKSIVTNINRIDTKVGEPSNITVDAGKNKSIVTNINRIDTKVGELSNITVEEGRDKTIVGNINRLDEKISRVNTKVGEPSNITVDAGKTMSIVENINRVDNRINDIVDNISDINNEKITGIIIDSTDIPHEPDDEGIVNLNGNITVASINITYDELVRRRNSSTLVPGQKYRITDYVTRAYVYGSDLYNSAEHPFDIIVEALNEDTLSEDAKAINHGYEDPGEDHFGMSNLSAWELKYCLDNDTTRFDWALNMPGDIMPDSSEKNIDGRELDPNNRELLYYYSDLNNNITRLWFDQGSGDSNDYSSNEIIRGWGKIKGPNNKNSQLCLYPKADNDVNSLNKNIAYFYYGYLSETDPECEYDGLPPGFYWRKAEKVYTNFVWSETKDANGEPLGGAIFLITTSVIFEEDESSPIKFEVKNIIKDSGKGVIYYMKDEWENEAPFDFKNIRIYSDIDIMFGSNQSVFNVDALYSQESANGTPLLIKKLVGYWYLFSGLRVDKGNSDRLFLSSLVNPFSEGTVNVKSGIIDTSLNNSNLMKGKITIVTAHNVIKPDFSIDGNSTYDLPDNIFLALYVNNGTSSEVSSISRNSIGFSATANIFTAGPGNGILGIELSNYCRLNNFYKGVMYEAVKPGTLFKTYYRTGESNSILT